MTLLEKFEKVNNTFWLRNELELIKVADEFAIGFANWFWEHHEAFYSGERDYYLEFNELLEIYKKEKKL